MRCNEIRRRLLERTLEGEGGALAGELEEHLQDCPACRDFSGRLAEVDAALWAMPLEEVPPVVTRRILEEIPPSRPPLEAQFLPWILWVPATSLLVGLVWAYLTLLWRRWPDLVDTLSPTLSGWPSSTESWLGSHKTAFSTVALSVAAGILLTVLGAIAGLYVGRRRAAVGR